jgi:hypothetical protein
MRRLLVTASVVPSSPILVTHMEALSSCETSVLTRATPLNVPEDAILHSHHHENLKSYVKNLNYIKAWKFSSWEQVCIPPQKLSMTFCIAWYWTLELLHLISSQEFLYQFFTLSFPPVVLWHGPLFSVLQPTSTTTALYYLPEVWFLI